jgi:hypothetical protein
MARASAQAKAGRAAADDGPVPEVSRDQALAYRVAAHQLDRPPGVAVADLAALDLGIQDSPFGTALLSLAARVPPTGKAAADVTAEALADGRRWSTVWAVRGAPHLLRAGDVRAFAAATWPASPEDAAARLAGYGAGVAKRGDDALAALRTAAEGLREVVTERMPKGDASGAVTRALPDICNEPCRSCGVVHISDQLMRIAALPAGLQVDAGTKPLTLRPIARWPGVPQAQDGASALVEAYLRLDGPAGPKEVAAYFQTTQRAVKDVWPDGLAEVRVDGAKAWLPEDRVDALRRAAPPDDVVRLLPRSDPWLMARDRERIVPGKDHRKALWPVLGFPGGVLVGGEVAGAWRTKASGKRLDVTVAPFRKPTAAERTAIESEAALVARLRAHADVRVTYDD